MIEPGHSYINNRHENVIAPTISAAIECVLKKYESQQPKVYSAQHQGRVTIDGTIQ